MLMITRSSLSLYMTLTALVSTVVRHAPLSAKMHKMFSFSTTLYKQGMKSVGMLRHCFQVVALAIFAYQMVLAFKKYTTFSSVPTEETKDIADALLPDIYICLKAQSNSLFLEKHGYQLGKTGQGMPAFIGGYTYEAFMDSQNFFVTWEGIYNLTYENITGIYQRCKNYT